MASASSPLAETPNTAVRPAGSAAPKRVRTHRRTSSAKNLSCAANLSGSKPGEYSWSRSVSSARRCAPTIIVDGTSAASRTPPHCEINWPSPANTTASAGSGGTYTVTSRPPSYSNVSVMSSPVIDIVDVTSQTMLSHGAYPRQPARYRRQNIKYLQYKDRLAGLAGSLNPALRIMGAP